MNIHSNEEFTLCNALYAHHSPKWEEKASKSWKDERKVTVYCASGHLIKKAISFSHCGCMVSLVLHFTEEGVGAPEIICGRARIRIQIFNTNSDFTFSALLLYQGWRMASGSRTRDQPDPGVQTDGHIMETYLYLSIQHRGCVCAPQGL